MKDARGGGSDFHALARTRRLSVSCKDWLRLFGKRPCAQRDWISRAHKPSDEGKLSKRGLQLLAVYIFERADLLLWQ